MLSNSFRMWIKLYYIFWAKKKKNIVLLRDRIAIILGRTVAHISILPYIL